jgi:tRNA threonylcarbamoyladenosine biosynthesis protein TsaB
MARRLPLVGIPTLDVIAAAQPAASMPLAAVLQAGRGRLAVGWYKAAGDGWQADGPAKVETAESLANSIRHPTIVCGELHAEERRRLRRKRVNVVLSSAANSVRRPALLAELAWSRWRAGSVDDPAALAPIYLHSAEPVPG